MNAVVGSQLLMKESFVEISYMAEDRIIIAKWKGFLTVDQVKKGCEVINQQVTKNKLTKHLSDHSQLKVLSKEVQEYLGGTWFNQVEKLGLRKLAVNLAEDVFAQATVKKVNGEQKFGQMIMDSFGSYESAIKWLNS
ncbi:hypothetical protein [Cesiribacter sp. SM1]|uniref:hypothetical protein n=1 Tax=Cesiribacter sp. SM1 TaxID=2861196 RepID=UPI001CD53E78|nr:hypothetical protein [Cesiribacter sp. SM1]